MQILKEFMFRQQSAPSAPASGYSVLYTKSDGKWYIKNNDNVETEITNVATSGAGISIGKSLTIGRLNFQS